MAVQGGALAGGGSGVIDPDPDRIGRIKINEQNSRAPRVQAAVHVCCVGFITVMALLTGNAGI
jgi:hypothetical protein